MKLGLLKASIKWSWSWSWSCNVLVVLFNLENCKICPTATQVKSKDVNALPHKACVIMIMLKVKDRTERMGMEVEYLMK